MHVINLRPAACAITSHVTLFNLLDLSSQLDKLLIEILNLAIG